MHLRSPHLTKEQGPCILALCGLNVRKYGVERPWHLLHQINDPAFIINVSCAEHFHHCFEYRNHLSSCSSFVHIQP